MGRNHCSCYEKTEERIVGMQHTVLELMSSRIFEYINGGRYEDCSEFMEEYINLVCLLEDILNDLKM
ncbi:hypothetical protein MKX73_03325 [Solibacillus sp. FSL W7-1436]|uniref:hypothetical protein n=1 Tax=Solibacillus sp. FSL W7-1436 TaxID=2921705 RepID=UPI0030FC7169